MPTEKYFVGVDVGTGSARAALVSVHGKVLKTCVRPIKTWRPQSDHYEQSSDDIWNAVRICVQNVVTHEYQDKVAGIGFDATCSLVVIDKSGRPLSVGANPESNIILWMDHRAATEARAINATKHELLKYVGGEVSLEMECPKLLWLKNTMSEMWWHSVGYFFDLPDFLTWKCTDDDSRSLCSTVCKWNYDAFHNRWSSDYFSKINLPEVMADNFHLIGTKIQEPGSKVGAGLSVVAAEELGLRPGLPVGTSMIDAHAGALGLFGCRGIGIDDTVSSKIALICGTSSCHMSVTQTPIWAAGVWGPYKNALFPGMYLNEAGQSATGVLIDHIVENHPAYAATKVLAGHRHIYDYLYDSLVKLAAEKGLANVQELTADIHVWPDYHGNRSPLADPNSKGMISGLTMKCDELNLAVIYLAFIQALAYGSKHILDSLLSYGRSEFGSLLMCGGLSKNNLFVQTHADACALPVLLPEESEMVLVGAAILGACAAGAYPDLENASKGMGGRAKVIQPKPECVKYHENKYRVFLKMMNDQRSYKAIMDSSADICF